jgi:hypothetical protein
MPIANDGNPAAKSTLRGCRNSHIRELDAKTVEPLGYVYCHDKKQRCPKGNHEYKEE